MDLIRRSVSLPEDVYESLRTEAFSKRISVNELMVAKFRGKSDDHSELTIQNKLDDDMSFFTDLSKKLGAKSNGASIIRKMRDRRAGEILSNR